MKTSMFPHTSL